jgi:hypothetical protein
VNSGERAAARLTCGYALCLTRRHTGAGNGSKVCRVADFGRSRCTLCSVVLPFCLAVPSQFRSGQPRGALADNGWADARLTCGYALCLTRRHTGAGSGSKVCLRG